MFCCLITFWHCTHSCIFNQTSWCIYMQIFYQCSWGSQRTVLPEMFCLIGWHVCISQHNRTFYPIIEWWYEESETWQINWNWYTSHLCKYPCFQQRTASKNNEDIGINFLTTFGINGLSDWFFFSCFFFFRYRRFSLDAFCQVLPYRAVSPEVHSRAG